MRIAIIVCVFSWSSFYVNTSAFSLTDELSLFFTARDDTSQCPHSPHPTCTTKSGAVPNAPCVFPFLINDKKVWSCTTEGGFPDPWCATGVEPDDCRPLFNQWGNCDEETCDGVFEPTTTTRPTVDPECANINNDDECVTVDGPQPNAPCWFPFKSQGVTHTTCTTQGGYPDPWCATLVDDNCNMVGDHWGTCHSSCPNDDLTTTVTSAPPPECFNTNTDCVTVSGDDTNEPCWFPFKIKDELHYSCTFEGGYPEPWCPTRVDQNCRVNGAHWGNCDPTCPNEKQSTTTVATTSETIDTSTVKSTTDNTGTPTTEQTDTSTTDHTEASTTVPPAPDCWYDYLCNTIINIGEGSGEDLVNASTCQAACKTFNGCNHFTWYKLNGRPRCWFLEACDKQDICPSPDHCKSGPADCKDLPEPCTHLEYTPGDNKIHWVALEDLNPYTDPIPYGTTCITSNSCDTWMNASGPVPEVRATCQSGTNWTLIPPDVTYADGSPFPKPSQGDPDC